MDFIIIGSGMAGLYAAYNIKKKTNSFLILEKNTKLGGRAGNEMFCGVEVVTGAGIGRKRDKLLYKLLRELGLETKEFTSTQHYSSLIQPENIDEMIEKLKKNLHGTHTFKEFATKVLGPKKYQHFLTISGYSDFEKEDAHDTLYNYGLKDNFHPVKAFHVPWKEMVKKLYEYIGASHFRFSSNVIKIKKVEDYFRIETEDIFYLCKKVVVATTIESLRRLFSNPIYREIEGQPFLRLYGKFSKKSLPILKKYVHGYTIVPGPLQKIIPMNEEKGVYMIAYNDNKNTKLLLPFLENTRENCAFFCELIETALDMPKDSIELLSIKAYYWQIGTHYYKPHANEIIYKAQHPEKDILVVGEVVSHDQGWTEGALDSVERVKKWF
jgi:hypothetical protein